MKHTCICLLIFLSSLSAAALPLIQKLANDDPVFRQLQEDIKAFHIAVNQNKPLPLLTLYAVKLPYECDVLALGARLGLPYEAIATLNGIKSAQIMPENSIIYTPNMPAIFARETNGTDIDRLILSWRLSDDFETVRLAGTVYRAFPGKSFHNVERAMYLGVFFRFPILEGRISSYFGNRPHPFSGHPSFHNGIDIAAPTGTPVIAARDGKVSDRGENNILGHYVVLDHNNGYETLYAHLSISTVQLNQLVQSGMIIGEVGVTGMTTGPHLHFEVRQRGNHKDPMLLLPKEKK